MVVVWIQDGEWREEVCSACRRVVVSCYDFALPQKMYPIKPQMASRVALSFTPWMLGRIACAWLPQALKLLFNMINAWSFDRQ